MRVICTSNEALAFDATQNDQATHHHLTFGADTAGHDPEQGPAPSCSLSITLPADEAQAYGVGQAFALVLDPAPVPGTVEGAKAQAAEANTVHPEDEAEDQSNTDSK